MTDRRAVEMATESAHTRTAKGRFPDGSGRSSHNERILDRMRGVAPQSATPETDADPRNPAARVSPDREALARRLADAMLDWTAALSKSGVHYQASIADLALLRDRLARLASPSPAVGEWRNIESAPKDGQIIWAWLYHTGIRALMANEHGAWVEVDNDDEEWSPKFWLPYEMIPAPPQEAKP